MTRLPAETLRNRYGWIDIGRSVNRVMPADLLVYNGHVVLVERVLASGTGQVIHSTSGGVIKRPGEGIQRQTMVNFEDFKGPLLKILRHQKVAKSLSKQLLRPQRR